MAPWPFNPSSPTDTRLFRTPRAFSAKIRTPPFLFQKIMIFFSNEQESHRAVAGWIRRLKVDNQKER